MRTATAQLPQIDASDDKVFTTHNAVIMLAGASAFAPVPITPSTYADRLGRHRQDTLTTDPRATLVIALAEALGDTARRLDLHDETITDPRTHDQNRPARHNHRQRLAHGSGYDEEHHAILRELQTRQTHSRNQPGGYWIAEANPDAAAQAITTQRPFTETPAAILA